MRVGPLGLFELDPVQRLEAVLVELIANPAARRFKTAPHENEGGARTSLISP